MTYQRGDVVVVPFPFSDLSGSKLRPALVLFDSGGPDLVLCQITSKTVRDPHAVSLADNDFASGSLRLDSNIRPNKLFTFDRALIRARCGKIGAAKLAEVMTRTVALLTSEVVERIGR